ncbi:NADH:flavin oxidoreductase/NADH oxidase, partial [Helicostylum pulchrum]
KETKLFRPSTRQSVTLSNRNFVSPIYSSGDGHFNDFRVSHYASFAIKGAGVVFIESSAAEPNGRITPEDAGIWRDTHIPVLRQITTLIKVQRFVPALQIDHAGHKASVYSTFHELSGLILTKEFGGWP